MQIGVYSNLWHSRGGAQQYETIIMQRMSAIRKEDQPRNCGNFGTAIIIAPTLSYAIEAVIRASRAEFLSRGSAWPTD